MDPAVDGQLLQYLTLITSSHNGAHVDDAWKNLWKLEEEHELINLIEKVKNIISNGVKNVNQTPQLLEFFSRTIDDNPFEVINVTSDTNNTYKSFFKRIAESKDLNLLCCIIETLINHRSIYLPDFESIAEFCMAIVHCLSLYTMPKEPMKVVEFKEKTANIFNYLYTVIDLKEVKQKKLSLIITCTDTFYQIIRASDLNSIPGAALAVVIQLVEPTQIPEIVQMLIRSENDENLSQIVSVLFMWLRHWLKNDTLSMWIEKFIKGLNDKNRFSALNSISNNCLKLILNILILPMARLHAMSFVHVMLIHMSTPTLFHKVIRDIESVFLVLKTENSISSIECAQDLVNCVCVLMRRFPGHSSYESLSKSLPVPPQHNIIMSLYNVPQWTENNQLIINNDNNVSGINRQVGLNNLGNTCYMNSVLQALVMTPHFCDQILAYDENSIAKICILHELQRLFALLLYSQRPYLSPTGFSQASRSAYFTPGQQHDSAEFLCHLLDILDEQERSTMTKCGVSNVTIDDILPNNAAKFKLQRRTITTGDNNSNNCDAINYNIESNDDATSPSISQSSLVYRVFGGESSTTYQCNQCHTSSNNIDHYWELQLSFPEEIARHRDVTVKDLINYYLTPEKLTGDNMYHCDRCNSLCDAQRIIKILRAPAHLILTLKHFHYDIDSRLKKKLFHKVTYNETIEIPVLNNGLTNVETYRLYAAVVHSGFSMDYGHYFTFARDRTKKWYKFNDKCVTETTLNEFFQLHEPCTPYILFYEKIEDGLKNEMYEKPTLAMLSKNIRNLIETDATIYQTEKKKNFVQNRTTQLANDDYHQQSKSLTRQRDNSDDDNPPPTNCRDSLNLQSGRFLF